MGRQMTTIAAVLVAACTGFTLGENGPGNDTWMEAGSIAVDPRTENAFVMRTNGEWVEGTGSRPERREVKTLYAMEPDCGGYRLVRDVSEYADVRMLFPAESVLIMAESSGVDRLIKLDPDSFRELDSRSTGARYNGTRLSSSRRFIAVADNDLDTAPIHVIDSRTLDIEQIPHDGDWLEAMWLHQDDRLVAIVFYDMYEGEDPRARILVWQIEQVVDGGWTTDEGGFWPHAVIDITVEGARGDILFSFTWVGVAPDDSRVVFPVLTEEGHSLIVLDVETSSVRMVHDAYGPVGFTPDSSTIVSYRYLDTGTGTIQAELLLVDAESLEVESLEIPYEGMPSYFVSHEGNFVVLVPDVFAPGHTVLYDLDREEVTEFGDYDVKLNEFVSRLGHDELWIVTSGTLYRLDFLEAALEPVPLGFEPEHVNILRGRDLLVLDAKDDNQYTFLDPGTLEPECWIRLP